MEDPVKDLVAQKLGLDTLIFSGKSTSGYRLKKSVLEQCREPQDLCINSDTFLKYFKVHEGTFKILKTLNSPLILALLLVFCPFLGARLLGGTGRGSEIKCKLLSLLRLRTCRKEITRFQTIKQDFMNQFSGAWWTFQERVDVVFEFQVWMLEQIFSAQRTGLWGTSKPRGVIKVP